MSRIVRVILSLNENDEIDLTFETCCVSWQETYAVVQRMRDRLQNEIDNHKKCPMYASSEEEARRIAANENL